MRVEMKLKKMKNKWVLSIKLTIWKWKLPIEVVEECNHVKAEFDPTFFELTVQYIAVHYQSGIINAKSRSQRSLLESESNTVNKLNID